MAFREQNASIELNPATEQAQTPPQAAKRLRCEAYGEQELDRQRVDVENVILTESKVAVLLSPLWSTSSEQSTPQKPSLSLSERLKMRKISVVEGQLDLKIMTQSHVGLSDEAVKYLRWQRRLVIAKV
ncbi:hypothetical protein GN244_ATG19878 [Phytophthora infestans]|uniref:Uncharacterized protein n=1 Tax=Phytophthora infestans TaxID=4787 RepID=A0A833RY83_PHYIN|nr:hypothetical protein GN244_ATG19878 [Phytophthora infestans]